MQKIITMTVGPLATNCYIIYNNNEALVIDPGAEGERVVAYLAEKELKCRYIINTHGHMDHIGGNEILKSLGAEILVHRDDAAMLQNSDKNLSAYSGGSPVTGPGADRLLQDGDKIEWCGLTLQVIHTPGHTSGGISLLMGEHLFSGDTLFAGGIGRTDLPGGDTQTLLDAILKRLFCLPDATIVYPGHGPKTTIGYEKKHNPFVGS